MNLRSIGLIITFTLAISAAVLGASENARIEGAGNFPFLRAQSSACGSLRSLAASWTFSGGPSGLSPGFRSEGPPLPPCPNRNIPPRLLGEVPGQTQSHKEVSSGC